MRNSVSEPELQPDGFEIEACAGGGLPDADTENGYRRKSGSNVASVDLIQNIGGVMEGYARDAETTLTIRSVMYKGDCAIALRIGLPNGYSYGG